MRSSGQIRDLDEAKRLQVLALTQYGYWKRGKGNSVLELRHNDHAWKFDTCRKNIGLTSLIDIYTKKNLHLLAIPFIAPGPKVIWVCYVA